MRNRNPHNFTSFKHFQLLPSPKQIKWNWNWNRQNFEWQPFSWHLLSCCLVHITWLHKFGGSNHYILISTPVSPIGHSAQAHLVKVHLSLFTSQARFDQAHLCLFKRTRSNCAFMSGDHLSMWCKVHFLFHLPRSLCLCARFFFFFWKWMCMVVSQIPLW